MAYAETTKVPIGQTKAEIERLLQKHGASAFGTMQDGLEAAVYFKLKDRLVRFKLTLPKDEQGQRSRWRALLLIVKGKLEAATTGIVTMEDEFLANTGWADNKTVGEVLQPQIREGIRAGGTPRLMLGSSR